MKKLKIVPGVIGLLAGLVWIFLRGRYAPHDHETVAAFVTWWRAQFGYAGAPGDAQLPVPRVRVLLLDDNAGRHTLVKGVRFLKLRDGVSQIDFCKSSKPKTLEPVHLRGQQSS